METAITILIYIHALFGAIGLLAGSVAIATTKGSPVHKQGGRWFVRGMLASSLISLFVARMPGHINDFLFSIGIFTLYMLLSGTRALRFKPRSGTKPGRWDWGLSLLMAATSLWMIVEGGIHLAMGREGTLFVFFGAIGMTLSLADMRNFGRFAVNPKLWLKSHIGRITGAFIASVTAFIVAGLKWDGIIFWTAPTLLGNFYIAYWIRKVGKGRKSRIAQ